MLKPKDILKALRKQHGYTIQEVSKGTGMTYTMCREYETGDRNLGLQAVLKLADFYHVSTDYILGREVTDRDERIKAKYQALSPQRKEAVEKFINMLAYNHKTEQVQSNERIILTAIGEIFTTIGTEPESKNISTKTTDTE